MQATTVKLSRREREVAESIRQGLSNREIATRLFIGERTVEYHVAQIFNKLGFHSRSQIATWISAHQESSPSTGPTSRTNLPVHLTSFIGRADDLSELGEVLERTRLLTLFGPAGIGKTRLALELATAVSTRYSAVTLVELAPVLHGALVTQAIASAAAIAEIPGQPLLATVIEHLAQSSALFVLDNCEHVVEASASVVESLLKGCPSVRVVATSREPLHASGETIWEVTALALPADDREASIQTLGNSEAILLFVERAQHADRRFSLNGTNAHAVHEICRHLDGLPLAIELAASRMSVMSPKAIVANLDRRFELLTTGGQTAITRHRSLEAALQWSYGLLSPDERALFERLAIFSGAFVIEAAEAVCVDEKLSHEEILPALLRLRERSLLTRHGETAGNSYRMLETVRQFASDRRMPVETQRLRRRHAEYFEALCTRAFRGSMTRDRAAWLAVLDENIDNIRSAFDWALTAAPTTALRIAANLEFFWRTRTYLTEGLERIVEALDRHDERTLLRVQGLSTAARLASLSERVNETQRLNEESLLLAREIAPPTELWYWIARGGMMRLSLEDPSGAEQLLREGLERWVDAGDPVVNQFRLCSVFGDLGWALCELGDLEAAADYSNRALAIVEQGYANSHVQGNAVDNLGFIELKRGDLDSAIKHWQTLLNVGLELQDFSKVFLALHGLASVAAAQSKFERAMRLFGAADSARRKAGRPSSASMRFVTFNDTAREGLGSGKADDAWAEGAGMTIDEAVAYALAKGE